VREAAQQEDLVHQRLELPRHLLINTVHTARQ
jgi:hypothetical protein